jgi:cell division protein FtsZ
MVRPGLINLDFADVRAVMDEMGKAMMGTGEAEGEDRARNAAQKAIQNPLLDEISLKGARGVLINITGGTDLTLFELDDAANVIRDQVDQDANIIVGSTLDDSMQGVMRVSVVATGIDAVATELETPVSSRTVSEPIATNVTRRENVDLGVAASRAHADVAGTEVDALPSFLQAQRQNLEEPSVLTAQEELPPPAYQPLPSASIEADDASFEPGQPSPETIARLKAAAARQYAAPTEAEMDEADRPRLGINSLIGRLTGHGSDTASTRRPSTQAVRVAAAPKPESDVDDDQVEIPAFLRRQAN